MVWAGGGTLQSVIFYMKTPGRIYRIVDSEGALEQGPRIEWSIIMLRTTGVRRTPMETPKLLDSIAIEPPATGISTSGAEVGASSSGSVGAARWRDRGHVAGRPRRGPPQSGESETQHLGRRQ